MSLGNEYWLGEVILEEKIPFATYFGFVSYPNKFFLLIEASYYPPKLPNIDPILYLIGEGVKQLGT